MDNLRPTKLDEIVGQDKVVSRLRIIIDSAQKRGAVLQHCLLDGPPGLGKTTLAMAVANELGGNFYIANAATLRTPLSILPYLSKLTDNSVLFIDEIHRLPKVVEEFLYPAMEDFRVDLSSKTKERYEPVSIDLAKFTLIGATTDAGMLAKPLQDRFGIKQHLELYSDESLRILLKSNSEKLSLNISDGALLLIARSSRGTPRIANNRLKWVRDFALSVSVTQINESIVKDALKKLGVTEEGLDENDIKYLTVLVDKFKGGPVGLETLAAALSISVDTIVNTIEPYLIQKGLIERTKGGRKVL